MEHNEMNLSTVRKYDNKMVRILGYSQFASVYIYSEGNGIWDAPCIEGPLFIYERSEDPYFSLFVLNRKGIRNFSMHLTAASQALIKGAPGTFLLHKFEDHKGWDGEVVPIMGFYMGDPTECSKISSAVDFAVKKLKSSNAVKPATLAEISQKPTPPENGASNNMDLLSMLKSAHIEKVKENVVAPVSNAGPVKQISEKGDMPKTVKTQWSHMDLFSDTATETFIGHPDPEEGVVSLSNELGSLLTPGMLSSQVAMSPIPLPKENGQLLPDLASKPKINGGDAMILSRDEIKAALIDLIENDDTIVDKVTGVLLKKMSSFS